MTTHQQGLTPTSSHHASKSYCIKIFTSIEYDSFYLLRTLIVKGMCGHLVHMRIRILIMCSSTTVSSDNPVQKMFTCTFLPSNVQDGRISPLIHSSVEQH